MAERLPEGRCASHISGSVTKPTSKIPNMSSSSASVLSREIESNGNSVDHQMLSYGTKTQTERPQWVVQAEPGVYITLSSFPAGGNELKRVRFRYLHIPSYL